MTQTSRTSASNPATRRLVLLAADGSVARVLAEPPAAMVHQEIRRLAKENPGEMVAAEWLSTLGWQRWITIEGQP